MLMGINFSKAIGTQCFFHIALQFFLIVCLKSDVELNSRFVFYFKCIPYRLWHKWGVYHSVSPCPMIHKETPFTDCQQIKSLGEQGLRVLRFRVSWGWAGTQCAFQVGKSVPFTITKKAELLVLKKSKKLIKWTFLSLFISLSFLQCFQNWDINYKFSKVRYSLLMGKLPCYTKQSRQLHTDHSLKLQLSL